MEEHCIKTSKDFGHQIVCTSVVDLSLDEKSSSKLLSLEQCLKVVQKKYPDSKIDIVIDEMDSEDLQRQQVDSLRETLEMPAFASSKILIALQPCEKIREVMHNDEVKSELTMEHCYEELADVFEMCTMVSTMRFTSNIGKAVAHILGEIEKKPNVYPCGHDVSDSNADFTDNDNSNLSSFNNPDDYRMEDGPVSFEGPFSFESEEQPRRCEVQTIGSGFPVEEQGNDVNNVIIAANEACDYDETPEEDHIDEEGQEENSDIEKSDIEEVEEEEREEEEEQLMSMDSSTWKVDASFRHLKQDETTASTTNFLAHFKHVKSERSGVNITGEKLRLLRLDTNKDVRTLAYFLKTCMQHKEKKMMLICGTLEMILLARAALETIALSYVEYSDNIWGRPARSTVEKKKIIEEWRNVKQVLLVDCRGCKGMECEEVRYPLIRC